MKRFLILPLLLGSVAASFLGPIPGVQDLAIDPGSSTPTAIALTWTAPDEWNSDGDVTLEPLAASTGSETLIRAIEYDLRYSSIDPGGSASLQEWFDEVATQAEGEPTPGAPGDPETFLVDGLSGGETYWFCMIVKFGDDKSAWSGLSNLVDGVTAADATPPDIITTLASDPAGEGSISLTWTAPADDAGLPGSGPVDRYEVRVSSIGPITPALFDNPGHCSPVEPPPLPLAPGLAQQFSVNGLEAATGYWFALKAFDDGDNGVQASTSPYSTTSVGGSAAASAGRELCLGSVGPGGAGLPLLAALLLLLSRRVAA